MGRENLAAVDTSLSHATKAYVDNAVLRSPSKEACKYATTAALPTVVYSNGSSGVGATLVAVGVGALSIDSASPATNDRILVKNQVTQAQNGIYTVTGAGSGIAVFTLTRTTDFDEAADIDEGDAVYVISGTVNAGATYEQTTPAVVTGTTAIVFVQSAGTVTAGTGISVSGITVSIDTSVTVDKTTAQTLSSKTLTSPVLNTGVSGTAVDTDGTLAGNSDTKLASQKATKAYADGKAPTAGTGIAVTGVSVAIDTATTVDKTTAQTLTNKTLTSPVLTTPTISTVTTKGDLLAATATATVARLGVGTNGYRLIADSTQTTGLGWAAPSQNQPGTVSGGAQNWSIPASVITALGSAQVLTANLVYYTPFVVFDPITLTSIAAEVTTLFAASNIRLGIYATTNAGQPTGAAVYDSGSLSSATTGVKSVTGLTTALAPGRYVTAIVCDSATVAVRAAVISSPWSPTEIDAATFGGGGNIAVYLRRVALTYGAFPNTGPAWTTTTKSTAQGADPMVVMKWTYV